MTNPSATSDTEAKNSDRFALYSARLRIKPERFDLSFWDIQVLFAAMFALFPLVILGMFYAQWNTAIPILVVMATLVITAKRALVVTAEGAWIEQRVVGIRWRRHALGLKPTVFKNTGVDWQNLAVGSQEPAFRARFRKNKRAVLAEWNDSETRKNDDADRLVAAATAEIKRLHPD